jgi:hypothetical protein
MVSQDDAFKSFREDMEPLLEKLEERRKSTVVPLLYSMNRSISVTDVDALYDRLISIGEQPTIDVILFSRGGDPDEAYLIGTMLQEFAKQKLVVIVPRYAKSAATLVACAADEIVMLPSSELGPVDLVVEIPETRRPIPVLSLLELVDMIGKMPKPIFPGLATISDVVEKMLSKVPIAELGDYTRLTQHMTSLAEKLLSRRMFRDEHELARSVAERLCTGYKSHSAAISMTDAKELGLRLSEVSRDVQDIVWNIHKLWVNTIIEYENSIPEETLVEALNLNVGKGIVFCSKPKEGKEDQA